MSTRYEVEIANGVKSLVLGYTGGHSNQGCASLYTLNMDRALRFSGEVIPFLQRIGRNENWQPGEWRVRFSGRTEREASQVA